MRLGLQVSRFTWSGAPASTGATWRQVARDADAAGLSSLWVKVEVCFYNGGEVATARTLRVTGTVELLDDDRLRHRLVEQDMPFLAAVGDADDPIHQIFRVAHGEAFIWGMGDMLREHELERATF